jgi:hypothetical protein
VVMGDHLKRPHLRVMPCTYTTWSWLAARSKSTCSTCRQCSSGSKKPTYSSIWRCANFSKESMGPGHIVSPEGITTKHKKQKSYGNGRPWRTDTKLGALLALCTYYKRFISSFSNIMKLLTKFTEEKQAFQWTPEVEAAFSNTKGGPMYCPYSRLPVARRKVRRWHRRE